MFDTFDNTLNTAKELNLTSNTQTFTDWVGLSDTDDFYRFSLSNSSSFNLTLNGLSANADVQLIQDVNSNGIVDQGEIIAGSYRTGSKAESIVTNLNAGDYYVQVYGAGKTAGIDYNLNLSAIPDHAGNTVATARNIKLDSLTGTYSDWVGSSDKNDYYRFSVSDSIDFSLALDGLSANADVKLLQLRTNGTTRTVASSLNGDNTSEKIVVDDLAAGNYLVRVYRNSGDTFYNLSLSSTPLDYTGNTLTSARQIDLNSTNQITEWVGNIDTNDYYRFMLGDNSSLNVDFSGLSIKANMQLLQFASDGTTKTVASYTGGNAAGAINLSNLSAGRYYLNVYQDTGNTFYNLSFSGTTNLGSDWIGQNLADSGIVNWTNNLAADGNLSRSDMIAILNDSKDNGVVDANEFLDLQTIASNANRFNMENYVSVLSNKIINGNVANQKYQGSALGNLYAGSSATQMENLVSKWFLGSDRPQSSYTYSYNSASLFQDGINANDVSQGQVGDCYFLCTLSSIAQEQPSYIQDMFIDNGDNTFTVRFFNKGIADYVTVDRYLPKAWWGSAYANATKELWVGLAEKAYAQLAESGWSRGANATNSYSSISGGWMDTAIQQLTGLSTSSKYISSMSKQQLIDITNSNQLLTAGFVFGTKYDVVNGHAYTISFYDLATDTFFLRNPWGYKHASLTWEQLVEIKAIVQWSNT